ncbi:MAG: hypothetical protein JWR34_5461 [Mycobacterium sp.]|nr:hypothetical protein [Mycobacterium sp.]
MPSGRLYIDPQALAVTTKVAASAEASLMRSAATAPAEEACAAAAAATGNTLDVVVAGAITWAVGGHEGVATAVATRGVGVGDVSATGFNALDAMNETNAVHLRAVAAQL